VTSPGKNLPKDVIDHWPEIFSEIQLNVLPIKYLNAVMINFKDGKTWEVKISAEARKEGWVVFEKQLSELVKNYEDNIENVDFKLDTIRVKKDIEKGTQKFFKKKKL
jgi:hypothetical protein